MRGDDVAAGVVQLGDVDADDLAVEVAALARGQRALLEIAAHSSWDSRLTWQRAATFSAVIPIEM